MTSDEKKRLAGRRRALRLIAGCGTLALMRNNARAQAPAMLKRPIPRSGEMLPAGGVGTWQTFDVGAQAPQREGPHGERGTRSRRGAWAFGRSNWGRAGPGPDGRRRAA